MTTVFARRSQFDIRSKQASKMAGVTALGPPKGPGCHNTTLATVEEGAALGQMPEHHMRVPNRETPPLCEQPFDPLQELFQFRVRVRVVECFLVEEPHEMERFRTAISEHGESQGRFFMDGSNQCAGIRPFRACDPQPIRRS